MNANANYYQGVGKEILELVKNVRAVRIGDKEIPAVRNGSGFTLYQTPECAGCSMREQADHTICMNGNAKTTRLLETSGYKRDDCIFDDAKKCLRIQGYMIPAVPRRYQGKVY